MTRPDDAPRDAAAAAAADLGAILSHPRRVRIIGALMRGRGSAKTLSVALGAPLDNVAYHLRVLFKKFEVVEPVATKRRRGATETVFELRASQAAHLLAIAVATYEAEASRASAPRPFEPATLAVDDRGAREIDAAISRCAAVVAAERDRCDGLDPGELTRLVVSATAIELAPLPPPEA